MKTLNITFEEDEFIELRKLKKDNESWHDAILRWSGVAYG